jgi:hypothetical protein
MYDISSVVISFICKWNIKSQIPTWPKIVVWWPATLIPVKTFSPDWIYLCCLVHHNSYHCTVNLKHGKLDKTKNITSSTFIYYKIFLFLCIEPHELLSKTHYDTFLLAQHSLFCHLNLDSPFHLQGTVSPWTGCSEHQFLWDVRYPIHIEYFSQYHWIPSG